MKERKKPTQSWIGRSIEEIEKEAFEKGWEAGYADACEIAHKFAEMVYKMRKAQEEERITRGWIMESSEGMTRHLRHFLSDAGEFCTFILEMARVAHHNEGNMKKVYDFMTKLTNKKTRSEDVCFCLDPEDIKHYKVIV